MSGNNHIYKTPITVATYFSWSIFIIIIGFLSFFLTKNPPVVGVIMIIFIIALIKVASDEIVVKEHCFEIYENRFFNLYKHKKVYQYKDVIGVNLNKNRFKHGGMITTLIIPRYRNEIVVHLKSGKKLNYDNVGVNYKYIAKAVDIICEKLHALS